jgi:glycosyltransferase involved in cell wall biosynthesis
MVFVNDGSRDNTRSILTEIAKNDSTVKVIHFSCNYGQTAAMAAAIEYASGNIVVAMDGDGQNDPNDISRLIEKINEGYDVVSGWRKNRQDKTLSRKIPSKIANKIISWISGVKLNDYGCSLKAYRKEIIKSVRLYGEMHRFIPIFAVWFGAKVTEIPVNHFARVTGVSKYGINRTFKVILDLLVVKFLSKYLSKPIYIMGGVGLFFMLIGIICVIWACVLKFVFCVSFVLTPLPLMSMFAIFMGFMAILIGLLSEMISRTYFESQNKKPYFIREGDLLNLEKIRQYHIS